MAVSPVSGALSQTQLAVLEQIRALRAAKPAAAVQATTAPVRVATPIKAKPIAAQLLATAAPAAGPISANRLRGSILNITV